jgi:hypothetical protein
LNGWFDGRQDLGDAAWNAFQLAYGWAKEWQILLAGVLVLFAALIVAKAIRKTAPSRKAPLQPAPAGQFDLDLRKGAKASETTAPANQPAAERRRSPRQSTAPVPLVAEPASPSELAANLEQLRSFIRSALAAQTLTAEKENSPAKLLCQRITNFRLERLPAGAPKAAHEVHAAMLGQLEVLRQTLKKESPLSEVSPILVQLNASARDLAAALSPGPNSRRQVSPNAR